MKSINLLLLQVIVTCTCFSQNVGIGTTTPVTRLHVSGTQSNISVFNGGSGMYLTLAENGFNRGYIGSFAGNDEDVDFGTYSGNTGKLHLTTLNTPRLTVLSNGNVGIGTTTPEQLFSVAGGMLVDQTNLNTGTVLHSLRFGSASGEAIGSKRNAGTNQYGLDFYTASINRMTIANNGNVGIGTNTPSTKLDVNGDINIEDRIFLNNKPGISGQVLVSGGSGSPYWRNTALDNNDRFFFKTDFLELSSQYSAFVGFVNAYSGSSAITYSNKVFTVNKSGFYAIEGRVRVDIMTPETFSNPSLIHIRLDMSAPSLDPIILYNGLMDYIETPGPKRWYKITDYSLKVYLAAGTTFQMYCYYNYTMVDRISVHSNFPLSIYLIAE